MQKSEWASWMQAIFSVIAIGAAFGIAWYQAAKARKLQREQQLSGATVVAASITLNCRLIENLLNSIKDECTQMLSARSAFAMSEQWTTLGTLKLPSEQQILLLAPVMPVASAALATACNQIDQLNGMIAGFVKADVGTEPIFLEFRVLMVRQLCKWSIANLKMANEAMIEIQAKQKRNKWWLQLLRTKFQNKVAFEQAMADAGFVDSIR